MAFIRKTLTAHSRGLLAFALAVLGLQAMLPTGHMIAPSASHVVSVIPCPTTNALAQAFAALEDSGADESSHHQMATTDMVDHAAMGHMGSGHGSNNSDDSPVQSVQPKSDCAFAGLASAADIPNQPAIALSLLEREAEPILPLPAVTLRAIPRLRPPLRAPPELA